MILTSSQTPLMSQVSSLPPDYADGASVTAYSQVGDTEIKSNPFNDSTVIDDDEHWRQGAAVAQVHAQIATYRESTTLRSSQQITAAENVAVAMDNAADTFKDDNSKSFWKRQAKKLRLSTKSDERESVLRETGRAILILITTPITLTGAMMLGCGACVEALGTMLSGMGKMMLKASIQPRSRKTKSK